MLSVRVTRDAGQPADKLWLVRSCVTVLGVTTLLPWNLMLSQADYFHTRTHHPPALPWLADNILSLIVNSYMAANLLGFVLLLLFSDYWAVHSQVTAPIIAIFSVILSQIAMACKAGLSGKAVALVTLAGSSINGLSSASLQSGTFSITGNFPPVYNQAYSVGMSLSGITTAALALVTSWRGSGDVYRQGIEYFSAAAAFVAVAYICFFVMGFSPFVHHHGLKHEPTFADVEANERLLSLESVDRRSAFGSIPESPRERWMHKVLRPSSSRLSLASFEGVEAPPPVGRWQLVKQLGGYPWAVCVTFWVTIAAYPALTASICSVRNPATSFPCAADTPSGRLYGDLFVPFSLLVFNCGDLAGRLAASAHARAPKSAAMLTYAVCRVALVACLALCNIMAPHHWLPPLLFRSDWWAWGFNGLLGATNGHLAALTLMHAPSLVDEGLRERCGTIMAFFLTCGLQLGSLTSLLLMYLLQSG